MEKENFCVVCGEKLKKKENSALYYCMKCVENNKKEQLRR